MVDPRITRLVNSRAAYRGHATRHIDAAKVILVQTFFELIPTTLPELQKIHDQLAQKLTDIKAKNVILEEIVEDDDLEAEIDSASKNVDDIQSCLADITKFIADYANFSARNQSVRTPRPTPFAKDSVRLPKLELPPFSGKILEWSSFVEMFTSRSCF